jgi:hypothetical protein
MVASLLALLAFFYATCMILGIVVTGICSAYYYMWMKVLPRWGNMPLDYR